MSSAAPQVAVITGGASGIGWATAERLGADGFLTVLADRDGAAAADAAERLRAGGATAHDVTVDVTEPASVARAFDATLTAHGAVDVLVNCAGFARPIPSAELDEASWAAQLDVHLGGTMRCCRAAYPALARSRRATIVNVSSVLGRVGNPMRLAYGTAKAGIEGMTRTLAVEWARAGICVNAVAPGYTRTPLIDALVRDGKLDPASLERRIPLRRLAEREEVAGAIAFLCGPDARYVTGQTLVVDGGMSVDGDWSVPARC